VHGACLRGEHNMANQGEQVRIIRTGAHAFFKPQRHHPLAFGFFFSDSRPPRPAGRRELRAPRSALHYCALPAGRRARAARATSDARGGRSEESGSGSWPWPWPSGLWQCL
jgi:hypothetical protein